MINAAKTAAKMVLILDKETLPDTYGRWQTWDRAHGSNLLLHFPVMVPIPNQHCIRNQLTSPQGAATQSVSVYPRHWKRPYSGPVRGDLLPMKNR